MTTEPLWRDNPFVLIDPRYLHRFFPSSSLTIPERLNAVIRLGAYVGVGLALVQQSMSWILLPVVAAVITMAWGDNEHISNNEGMRVKKRISRREKALHFLAMETLSGKTRDIEHRHRIKNKDTTHKDTHKKRFSTTSYNIYNDLDTNLQKVRNERAHLSKTLDTGLSDSPGFARTMMKRDKERYIKNGRHKYSRR